MGKVGRDSSLGETKNDRNPSFFKGEGQKKKRGDKNDNARVRKEGHTSRARGGRRVKTIEKLADIWQRTCHQL